MRLLKEEVGNIMRDREILCVVSLHFFRLLYCFFFKSYLVDQGVELEGVAGNIRESLFFNHHRSLSPLCLPCLLLGNHHRLLVRHSHPTLSRD